MNKSFRFCDNTRLYFPQNKFDIDRKIGIEHFYVFFSLSFEQTVPIILVHR